MKTTMTDSRKLPVRNLTPEQCRALRVHAHECSDERRKAYLYKASGADWKMYFSEDDGEAIREWIRKEPMGPITQEQFDERLHALVGRMTASDLLSHGEVYATLAESLNNEILEQFSKEQEALNPTED